MYKILDQNKLKHLLNNLLEILVYGNLKGTQNLFKKSIEMDSNVAPFLQGLKICIIENRSTVIKKQWLRFLVERKHEIKSYGD